MTAIFGAIACSLASSETEEGQHLRGPADVFELFMHGFSIIDWRPGCSGCQSFRSPFSGAQKLLVIVLVLSSFSSIARS